MAIVPRSEEIPVVNLPAVPRSMNFLVMADATRPPRTMPVPIQPQKKYFVYTLCWPTNARPFYVGKGNRNRSRLSEHLSEARRGWCHCPKCEVIKRIWQTGRAVFINYLFETDDEAEALRVEARTIRELSAKYRLCNLNGKEYSEPPPPQPLPDLTYVQVLDYFDLLGLSKQEHKRRLEKWGMARIGLLKDEQRELRRQRHPEKAEAIQAQIDEILVILGLLHQPRLL